MPGQAVAPLAAAVAWLDGAVSRLAAEPAPLGMATGRVLATDCLAATALPETDTAMRDGFAVRAEETIGASIYNPLTLAAVMVAAGDPLPAEADAVIPLASAEAEGSGAICLVEPVARGENIERQGAVAMAGAVLASVGTELAAPHLGLLAAAGLTAVPLVRRPSVDLLLVEPRPRRCGLDSNRLMLRTAIARDGGVVGAERSIERARSALVGALASCRDDIILVVGGTGDGPDDHAAGALAEAGELVLHGIAMRPGETTGLGRTGAGVPVVLLPAASAACLWSYELLAGRAVRRLGGRDPELPFRRCRMIAARKIVSAVGTAEICGVRFGETAGTVTPLPSFAEIGLMAAVAGDGFVIIPAGSEGYPAGAAVNVYLHERHRGEES